MITNNANQKDDEILNGISGNHPINRTPTDWVKLCLWIVAVVAVGMLAINQTFAFFYKAEFLKSPCQVCGELNPGVQECINTLNQPRPSYWTPEGWTDPYNETRYKIEP